MKPFKCTEQTVELKALQRLSHNLIEWTSACIVCYSFVNIILIHFTWHIFTCWKAATCSGKIYVLGIHCKPRCSLTLQCNCCCLFYNDCFLCVCKVWFPLLTRVWPCSSSRRDHLFVSEHRLISQNSSW